MADVQATKPIVTHKVDFSGAEPYFRLDLFFQFASGEAIVHIILNENVPCGAGPLLTISGAHDATGMTLLCARENIDYGDIQSLSCEIDMEEEERPHGRLLLRMSDGVLHIAGDQEFVDWASQVVVDLAESEIVSLAEVMAAVRRAEDTLLPPITELPAQVRHELEQALKNKDLALMISIFRQAQRLAEEATRRLGPVENGEVPQETLHLAEIGRSLVDLLDKAVDGRAALKMVSSLLNQGVDPEPLSFYGVTKKGRGVRTIDIVDGLLINLAKSSADTPLGAVVDEQKKRKTETKQQRRSILRRIEETLSLHLK